MQMTIFIGKRTQRRG